MQKLADELMTDKDIAAAERLDGTNTADLFNSRNDGYFKARTDKGEVEGQDGASGVRGVSWGALQEDGSWDSWENGEHCEADGGCCWWER